ncbi:MAG TPA: hypothetical protein VIJ75_12120 [Hanamia sp.]
MSLEYGDIFKLIINEEASFVDGLSILLTSFSHKHSMVAGPTKATAYINLTKDNAVGQILLSVHGKDEDPTVENFDSLCWNEYEFQLKGFNYDKNIELIVKRN